MSEKNLFSDEARKKIKDMAESIDFTMLATHLGNAPVHAIPMSTKKVDDMGNIWFLSGENSDHNGHIRQDKRVQLFYGKPSDMEFLNVYGHAEIIKRREVIEDLYQESDDNWFNGVDDPNVSALKITPAEAYYWDTKHGKLVSLLKMGYGAITGQKTDLGEEGKLKV